MQSGLATTQQIVRPSSRNLDFLSAESMHSRYLRQLATLSVLRAECAKENSTLVQS